MNVQLALCLRKLKQTLMDNNIVKLQDGLLQNICS